MILGFDTSGPYCSVALLAGNVVLAARHQEMAKGQAETLMPTILATLEDAGTDLQSIGRIAVGTGPGNFTGIRISVAAARGLALSLCVPATGVTLFDALSVDAQRPYLACLQATKSELYISERHDGWSSEPVQRKLHDIEPPSVPNLVCIGHRSDEVAAHLGLTAAPAAYAPAIAIARFASQHPPNPDMRPVPTYLRAPDAAPPRDPAPVILT